MNNIYYDDYFNMGYEKPVNNQNLYYGYVGQMDYRNISPLNYSPNNVRENAFYTPNEGFAKGNMQTNTYSPYKLVNPKMPVANSERQKLLLEVQEYSFAMWDLNLYLNTHPTDTKAMSLFEQYRTLYNKALSDYENKYGSLNVGQTNTNSSYWPWNKEPWPWEVE